MVQGNILNSRSQLRRTTLFTFKALGLLLFVTPIWAQAQVLDDVDVSLRRDGSASIRLKFSVPVQAVRSVPQTSGKTLYISVRLTGAGEGTRPETERTTNFDNLDGRLPLSEVDLELNGAEGDGVMM